MTDFVRHAALLFLALRAGDAVNLLAGLWFVPTFVTPREIGAVLPVTSFATSLAMPVFAFALAVTKETADLRGRGETGRLTSFLVGVFAAFGALALLALAVAALLVPRFVARMGVTSAFVGFLAAAGALLGCFAPVCTDALQGLKRFGALGAVEFSASLARFCVLAVAMPVRPLAGYFAAGVAQPLVRAFGSLAALWRDLRVPAEPYWTRATARALAGRFVRIALYLTPPMVVATQEMSALRLFCSEADSAGYYLATRLTDLLGCLTLPVLLVLFPYAADAAREGRSTRPLVAKSCAATAVAALVLWGVCSLWGAELIGWLPNGSASRDCARHLPVLLAINALTAAQVFCTNAEVAAGRFGFLAWHLPLHLAFLAFWSLADFVPGLPLGRLLGVFLAGAALRALCAFASAFVFPTFARRAGRDARKAAPPAGSDSSSNKGKRNGQVP